MKLVYDNGDNKGKEVEITERGITVGRYNGCDIQIDEDGISRKHCHFRINPDKGCIVEDLNSTNGVKVNGDKIDHKQVLEHEDKVEVGKYRFIFHAFNNEAEKKAKEDSEAPPKKSIVSTLINLVLALIFIALLAYVIYLIYIRDKSEPISQGRGLIATLAVEVNDKGLSDG